MAHRNEHYALVSDGWDHFDALALESIGERESDGVGLTRIIGLVDYVDRMVLTHDEMEQALGRLLAAGLIEETNLNFRRTTLGQELHSRSPATTSIDRARWIMTYLQDRINCPSTDEWSLPHGAFENALTAYHEEMRRLIERDE